MIDQPNLQGLGSIQEFRRPQHFQRARLSNDAGQEIRATTARRQAYFGVGFRESCGFTGDTNIAG